MNKTTRWINLRLPGAGRGQMNRILGLAAAGILAANAAWAQGQGSVNGSDYATPYAFVTIAGNIADAGEPSVDGTNSLATFDSPQGITMDTNGNLYVTDNSDNIIRKLTPAGTNWVVTTIAGDANDHTGSQDGSNRNATFNEPTAIAMDRAGNLYVADSYNNTVRRLTPAGANWNSSTIAGTANPGGNGFKDGTNGVAQFFYPEGLAVDAATNIYVADTYNNVIRRISPVGTNWVVTTIAGSVDGGNNDGTNEFAGFNFPAGIAVDASGNLFVGDAGNSLIRKITPMGPNWVVTTIAGNPLNTGHADGTSTNATFFDAGGYSMGIAVDANDNLYVADSGNGLIRKVSPAGTNWVTTTLAGDIGASFDDYADGTGTNAVFVVPAYIVTGADGGLFVTDSGAGTVREGTLAAAPVAPPLAISSSAHAVTISWPGTGYTLQTNASLTTTNWAAFGQTANTNNGTNSVTVLSPAGTLFFRLTQ